MHAERPPKGYAFCRRLMRGVRPLRMRAYGSSFAILVSGALLSACDFTAGVYRVSNLEQLPLPACVEETLRTVAGVTKVTYTPTELNGRPLDRFRYHAEGVNILVDIESKAAHPTYIQYYEVFNTVPPKDLVMRLRPVMVRVDKALESHCGMLGLSENIEEHCSRGLFRPTNCTP